MGALLVEAVWVWEYALSAQKWTYGRFNENGETGGYSSDYLQASGACGELLNEVAGGGFRHTLRLRSPGGFWQSGFVGFSNDRHHLAWDFNSPPEAWRRTPSPSPDGPGTIPGNPDASTIAAAEADRLALERTGIRAYLVAVKLRGESGVLHLRAYLTGEPTALRFADVEQLPAAVRAVVDAVTGTRGCRAARFSQDHQIYFDSDSNHDSWSEHPPVEKLGDDLQAESLPTEVEMVDSFYKSIDSGHYEAPDWPTLVAARGSAQKAFAKRVKANYGGRCAVTGISTPDFLVASHIVPWAVDKTIRLDPANGICLSILIDRAFEASFLAIEPDYTIHVDWARVGDDEALRQHLAQYDNIELRLPSSSPPDPDYLRRRRAGFQAR